MNKTLYERDAEVIAKLHKLRFFPLAVKGGMGSYLIGEDGRRLLDFSASWGAAGLGYSHPGLNQALARALNDQAGASILSGANEPAVSLAERLLELVPGSTERRVFFGHSGSDANETVYRAITAATGRPGIISFKGSYHGGTAASMAISGHSSQEHAEKARDLVSLTYPDPFRLSDTDKSGKSVLEELEYCLETQVNPERIAALFLEPIQSDGGMIVPPFGFFRSLCEICRSKGILIVCDEVKVGLGRSGKLHCFEHEGIVPDIVTFGKSLGAGLPVSAVVGPAAILDFAATFSIQTLHGNPLSAAAGHAMLDAIQNEKLPANAEKVGKHLFLGLQKLAQKHPLIGDVRGRGLAIGVELVADRQSREPAAKQTAKLVYRAFELGLVLFYVGMHSNVLEITPPLNLSVSEADTALSILDQVFYDLAAGKVHDNVLQGFEGW